MTGYWYTAKGLGTTVLNLFDTRYYESIYDNGGHVVPGTERAVQVTTRFKF